MLEYTTTFVTCDGRIWGGFNAGAVESGGPSGWTKSAGAGGPAPNNDANYKASDGWYFRDMQPEHKGKRWEFYRFKDGSMEIHNFATDQNPRTTSPLGSANFRTKVKVGSGSKSSITMLTQIPQTCGS